MSPRKEISQEDFVAALCTVATVVGGGLWNQAQGTTGRSMKRPAQAPAAAMPCQAAARYCGFGRTRFRELVAAGVFPKPKPVEGRKRWLKKDLDAALARMDKPRPRSEE